MPYLCVSKAVERDKPVLETSYSRLSIICYTPGSAAEYQKFSDIDIYDLVRRFARDNCPSYLEEANFRALKDQDLIARLNIVSGTFMDALKQRKYSKVRNHSKVSVPIAINESKLNQRFGKYIYL